MHPRLTANLLRFAVERTRPSHDPAPTITAPLTVESVRDPDKGLLPQCDAQFEQSARVRNGVVPQFRLVRR